jgi:hypothetical protein
MGKLKGIDGSFKGHHFDREIIVLCVRWYLRYQLSFRDLTEMMAERGLSLAHAPKEVPVGVQTLPKRGRHNLRYRANASHSQRSV